MPKQKKDSIPSGAHERHGMKGRLKGIGPGSPNGSHFGKMSNGHGGKGSSGKSGEMFGGKK